MPTGVENEENILDEIFGDAGDILNKAKAAASLGGTADAEKLKGKGGKLEGREETKDEDPKANGSGGAGDAENVAGVDAALALAEALAEAKRLAAAAPAPAAEPTSDRTQGFAGPPPLRLARR